MKGYKEFELRASSGNLYFIITNTFGRVLYTRTKDGRYEKVNRKASINDAINILSRSGDRYKKYFIRSLDDGDLMLELL